MNIVFFLKGILMYYIFSILCLKIPQESIMWKSLSYSWHIPYLNCKYTVVLDHVAMDTFLALELWEELKLFWMHLHPVWLYRSQNVWFIGGDRRKRRKKKKKRCLFLKSKFWFFMVNIFFWNFQIQFCYFCFRDAVALVEQKVLDNWPGYHESAMRWGCRTVRPTC